MISNKKVVQCMVVYQLLKSNHVGRHNAISGIDICKCINENNKLNKYFDEPLNKVALQHIVTMLRRNEVPNKKITRRIGSSRNGYWLETKKDNGLNFLKNLAISHVKTAVKSGVPLEYFYQVLNSMENSEFIDNQTYLEFDEKKQKDLKVIKCFSDDLLIDT